MAATMDHAAHARAEQDRSTHHAASCAPSRCGLLKLLLLVREILLHRWRCDVARHPANTDARSNPHHGRDRGGMRGDVDLLAKQQPRVEIMHMHGSASESLDQMPLHRAEPVLASQVLGYAFSDGVERFASFSPAIQSG